MTSTSSPPNYSIREFGESAPQVSSGGGGAVLIVEDDIGICTLERLRLERAGYRVLAAATVEEAEDLISRYDVEVMILDNRLAGDVDGIELYERLKAAGYDLPVIMVTGFSDEATVIKALKTGVRDFITKSDQFLDALPDAVERVLKQIRTVRELAAAELRCRKLSERFQGIFQSSKDAIGYSSMTGQLLEVNDAFEQLTGYSRAELLRMKYQDFTPGDHQTLEAERVKHVIESGEQTEYEKEYLCKNGKRIPVALTVFLVRDPDGRSNGLAAIIKDMRERKHAEQALREKDSFLRLIVEQTPAIFFSFDRDLRITSGLGAGLSALNLTPNELQRGSIVDLFPAKEPNFPFLDACQRALAGESISLEIEWRGRVYHCHIEPLRVADGSSGECIGVALDITEQKIFQKRMLRSERLESLGTLAGGIAHDLNNVLTPIVMAVDLLKMKYADPVSESLLNMLQTSGQRATEMVKQVLSYARGSPGLPQPVMLQPLINEVGKFLDQTFAKSIVIYVSTPADLPKVSADSTQIHQMLVNLAVNARDAMPGGGRLSITAVRATLDDNEARKQPGAKPGTYSILAIEDTGTGIAPDIIDKIFDPFFTTKEVGHGTGLGLFNVAGIVKNHNGFLAVQSEVGKGTRFTIGLPALQTETSKVAQPASVDVPMGRGEQILIVDDETAIRELMRQTLEPAGYRVLTAADGVEATTLYAQHGDAIQLVIVDLMMPNMDGVATAYALHRLDPNVRIILASGYQKNRSRELPSFTKKMLTKPFTSTALLLTVHEVLTAPVPEA